MVLLIGSALIAGGAAVFAFFYLFIPHQRRKGAEALVQAAVQKAEALREAAKVVTTVTEQQVARVEERSEQEKTQDPVAFANEFIRRETRQ